VNEALDLRISIQVLPINILLFPFFLILRDGLIKLLKLGALMPTMSVGFRRMVFSSQVQVFTFKPEVVSWIRRRYQV
jgi:hypothetical protein